MNNNGNIIEKIKALLRKTEARGATREESEAALAKAQEMMTKYNIDKIDVEDTSSFAKSQRQFNIHKRVFNTGRKRSTTDQYISWILIKCFKVRVIWSKEWIRNVKTGEMKKKLVYWLVGEPDDTALAEVVIQELHEIMKRLFSKYQQEHGDEIAAESHFTERTRAELKHGFYAGMRDGFINAAERGEAAAVNAATVDQANRYAIVVVDKAKAIQSYIKANIPTTASRSGGGSKSGRVSDHAYDEGYRHGQRTKVGLRKLE